MPVKTVLRLNCSPSGEASVCSALGNELIALIQARYPMATVRLRDLADAPPSAVDQSFTNAMPFHQSAEAAVGVAALQESERLIRELEASDMLVICTPMHNFTVPAVLKLWLDQIVRFGRTFKSTPDGKVGLLQDRPAYIVIAAGGFFLGDRARQPDFLTPYLRAILATIGIFEVTFFVADGASREREQVLERVLEEMRQAFTATEANRRGSSAP